MLYQSTGTLIGPWNCLHLVNLTATRATTPVRRYTTRNGVILITMTTSLPPRMRLSLTLQRQSQQPRSMGYRPLLTPERRIRDLPLSGRMAEKRRTAPIRDTIYYVIGLASTYTRPRPSLLLAKEPATLLRKRAATGVSTNEQVGELGLVPARPAKKTRSGRTVNVTERAMGAE